MTEVLFLPVALAGVLTAWSIRAEPRVATPGAYWCVLALTLATVALALADGMWLPSTIWFVVSVQRAMLVGMSYEVELHRRPQ